MPSLCGSLPFIDHATQIRMDETIMDRELESTQEVEVEMNVEVDEREEIKLEAHQTMEALQLLEQGWGAVNSAALERCRQLMVDFRKELLLSMGASTTTNMASGGSISRKQQLSAKRGAIMPNISQELIGSSPNTSKTHTGRLQRGARRAKRRLPICDTEKVRCLHCDGLTLTSRDSNANCCKNCGCILPCFEQEP